MTARPAAALLLTLVLAGPAAAGWDTARVTSPDSVDELKDLQARVKATTAKVTPATVGLLVGFGAGSGVIVSDDGLILTAAHVIGGAGKKLQVVLADGRRVNGVSLGLNAKVDSGMARITDKVPDGAAWPGASEGKWPKAELGESKPLKKGQWVVALGHHGGPKRDRAPPLRVGRFSRYTPASQALRSDCTLVGGDSGGPLFDLDGKVIGIHSRIGLFIDENLHVPVDAFKDEWEKMVESEDIGRGAAALGAEIDTEIDAPTVLSVEKGGPAARAGLKPGDRIVRVEGDDIETKDDLRKALGQLRAGQEAEIEVDRAGKSATLTVYMGSKAGPKRKPKAADDE